MNITSSRASTIGLSVLFSACAVLYFFHDYTYGELEKNFILGTHGVEIVSIGEDSHPRFLPWEPLEKNLSLNAMLERLCIEAIKTQKCFQEKTTRFRIFTQEHLLADSDGTSYLLERNTVPVALKDMTSAFLDSRLKLLAGWAKKNQQTDGSFPYLYEPSSDTYPSGEYVVRQLVFAQGLFATAHALSDAELETIATRNESRILREYYRSEGEGKSYITEKEGPAPVGDTALAILMMREHRGNTLLTSMERSFGRYILSAQRADGSFQTFRGMPASTQDEQFYSGEALSALARLYAADPVPSYATAIRKGYEYYRPKIERDFQPQYAPWHIQAYTVAYNETHEEAYADYVYWLADGLIETMLNNDKRAKSDEVGRFFNPEYPSWGPPHSSSTGIYTEGLTYAYLLAQKRGDIARMQKYSTAVLDGARSLLLVQWTPESAYYLAHPEKVVGSFKVTITDNRGRIDQIGHAGNALPRVKTIISGQQE